MPSSLSKSEDQPKITSLQTQNGLVIQTSSIECILLHIPPTTVLPETLTNFSLQLKLQLIIVKLMKVSQFWLGLNYNKGE